MLRAQRLKLADQLHHLIVPLIEIERILCDVKQAGEHIHTALDRGRYNGVGRNIVVRHGQTVFNAAETALHRLARAAILCIFQNQHGVLDQLIDLRRVKPDRLGLFCQLNSILKILVKGCTVFRRNLLIVCVHPRLLQLRIDAVHPAVRFVVLFLLLPVNLLRRLCLSPRKSHTFLPFCLF